MRYRWLSQDGGSKTLKEDGHGGKRDDQDITLYETVEDCGDAGSGVLALFFHPRFG